MAQATLVRNRDLWQYQLQFHELPTPRERSVVKSFRFLWDPESKIWTRSLDGVGMEGLVRELERVGVKLEILEHRNGMRTRLGWQLSESGRDWFLRPVAEPVAENTDSTPASEATASTPVTSTMVATTSATSRVIRARRCWECGSLRALDRRDQTELDRRLREAVAEMLRRLREEGRPPYLASAPVPNDVQVVGQFYCGCERDV